LRLTLIAWGEIPSALVLPEPADPPLAESEPDWATAVSAPKQATTTDRTVAAAIRPAKVSRIDGLVDGPSDCFELLCAAVATGKVLPGTLTGIDERLRRHVK
jgi:hypothetical protein